LWARGNFKKKKMVKYGQDGEASYPNKHSGGPSGKKGKEKSEVGKEEDTRKKWDNIVQVQLKNHPPTKIGTVA